MVCCDHRVCSILKQRNFSLPHVFTVEESDFVAEAGIQMHRCIYFQLGIPLLHCPRSLEGGMVLQWSDKRRSSFSTQAASYRKTACFIGLDRRWHPGGWLFSAGLSQSCPFHLHALNALPEQWERWEGGCLRNRGVGKEGRDGAVRKGESSCVKSAHCSFKISHILMPPFLCAVAEMLR